MTTVSEYNAALPAHQKEIADALAAVIESVLPGKGAVWHGAPVWSLGPAPGKQPVCLVKAHPRHVTFGLWRGQELADRESLEPGSRTMASVKLTALADVDAARVADWVRQARDLEG
ncbi:DUF1801 domain-containing protein [Actinokineospora terrae]|uniref:YdhG-like domain-containing protein n=1 Tax=Actinokineospora terrae TaxID=155974 RepID=A0A1H9KLK3_9PSEU|nr:DUF1801 domain-containing protein [Actinokineospora terrae]SEQ99972.1 protein of unknown function (DU1801) [Actinokineospora terrae]